MAVRPVLRLGHPVLRTRAERVEPDRLEGEEVQGLIDDLVETLRDSGGVGLAAPQVGEALQVFVYEVPAEARPDEPVPLRVLVNPMVEPHARELVYDWEGCLSIPELRGLVPRYPEVRVEATDRRGEPQSFIASGFEARIIQHEYDHLNGVVFLDRMRDFQSLAYEPEWLQYMEETPGEGTPAEGGAPGGGSTDGGSPDGGSGSGPAVVG